MDCLSKFSLLKFEKEQDNIIKTNKKIINNKIIRNRPIWEYVKWQWDIDVIKSINKIIKILNISMALI